MKATALVLTAAVLSAAATAVFAQEAESDAWMRPAQASVSGNVTAAAPATAKAMPADRAKIRAEAAAALRSGELAIINAEAHDFALDRTVDTGTRLAKK